MQQMRLRCALRWSALFLMALSACGSDERTSTPHLEHPQPEDPHEFISAEGQSGQELTGAADAGASSASKSSDAQRTVEEGDIYRVLGSGRLLNLNPYRGLQVIDLSDVSQPKLIGRLKEAGRPVEMYVLGERAIVLLNNWTGYWGGRDDVVVERRTGGLILNVDLRDPSAPTVLDREYVPGQIQTSRLTREGDRAALYIAGTFYECTGYSASSDCSGTVVKSLDVSGSDIVPRSTLQLGGWVSAVQATPRALLVARAQYANNTQTNTVSLVDISRADGSMVEGGQVPIRGRVQSKFNLDLHGSVLRVVSGSSWSPALSENHLETFDVRDIAQPSPIDHCTFGAGEQLYATLFLQERAFFVTYFRQDPFHAFSVDAAGKCQERSQFIVSGWNDFFTPVSEGRRLIGIGTNDEQQRRRVSVSLYDITNLDNANPLLARAEVEADNSTSTASHDDKAYTVLEGAVSVPAGADPAQTETGLVLLPFASYGTDASTARAGVQIYTFGDRTLTRRGVMNHGQIVERTFRAAPETSPNLTANLSSQELSLFDTQDPDAPTERGRLVLAPSYSDVLDYGPFLVRVRDTRADYQSWWRTDAAPPPAHAEVIAKGVDPDAALPLARIEIPAGARTFRVGTLLVSVSTVSSWTDGQSAHRSTIRTFDLQNPTQPVERSSLETDRLLPAYGYGWGPYFGRGPMMCGVTYGNYYDDFSRVLSNAIVFGRNLPQQASLGLHEQCSGAHYETPACRYDDGEGCTWLEGWRSCSRKIDSDQRVCEARALRCTRSDGKVACEPIDVASLQIAEHCYTTERIRYWQSLELDVLDLRDPSAPKLTPVTFAPTDEAVGLVLDGQSVYYAFKRPASVAGDARPFVKYFFREVGLADPALPAVGEAVNVPGELLAVRGASLVTRDLRWSAQRAETWLHSVRREGDRATIVSSVQYEDRDVTDALVDDQGRLLVTHRELYRSYAGHSSTTKPALDKLAILRMDNLALLGETNVDSWADMTQAVGGRVLFSVPAGMLVVNAQDASRPYAQAYFPYTGWQRKVTFDGASVLVASGPYGIQQLDATTHNLLPR